MAPCCNCNGKNAVCKRCTCVQAGRPCSTCLPLKMKRCSNTLESRTTVCSDLVKVSINKNNNDVTRIEGSSQFGSTGG